MALSNALGYPMDYAHPSEIMEEIARLTPTFAGVTYEKLNRLGSVQWPCNEKAPEGTPVMHVDGFVRGKGRFMITEYVPTDEKTTARFPLLLTTGRILSQYNVGAQTRRTGNVAWHAEDILDLHPWDAENRGIEDGDLVALASRAGETTLRARISERMQPGVVYTTFHHPEVGRQRGDHGVRGLGHRLPGVQGDRGAGAQGDPQVRMAGEIRGAARGDDACGGRASRGAGVARVRARRLKNTRHDSRQVIRRLVEHGWRE